jgi:tetratricopeptide (TPR) repeat protein
MGTEKVMKPALRAARIRLRVCKALIPCGAIPVAANLVDQLLKVQEYNDYRHYCINNLFTCDYTYFSYLGQQLDLIRNLFPVFLVLGIAIALIGIFLTSDADSTARKLSPPPGKDSWKIAGEHDDAGVKAWRSGDRAGAEASFRKAIGTCPEYTQGLFDLGTLLVEQGRKGEAIDILNKLVEIDPTAANAWFSLGNVYASLGEWKDAVQAFQMVLKTDRFDVVGWYNLGNAMKQGGNVDGAIHAYREGLSNDPDEEAKHQLAAALHDLDYAGNPLHEC